MPALPNCDADGWVAVIDDDASIRRSLSRLFRIHGIAARTFASAEEYLGRESCVEPRCLVVDVNLGGMSGFDLRDRLDADEKTTPIIFITAMEEVGSAQLRGRSEPHACLRKPFDTKALIELVHLHVRASAVHMMP